jgi:hypothetical protein
VAKDFAGFLLEKKSQDYSTDSILATPLATGPNFLTWCKIRFQVVFAVPTELYQNLHCFYVFWCLCKLKVPFCKSALR